MKKFLFYAILIITISTGCTKSNSTSYNGSPTSSGSTGVMSASAGASPFSSTNCYESSAGEYYSVTATSGNAAITIHIKSANLTTGGYSVDSTGLNNSATYTPNGTTIKTAKSGTVNISTINVGISIIGTFNFTCTDGTVVSNGTFTAVI